MTDPGTARHTPSPRARGARLLSLLGMMLMLVGAVLAYAALFRRWGYYQGTPPDLGQLSPADRAALTVYGWDIATNTCGPFPVIWPVLALLSTLVLLVPAIRGRETAHRFWSALSVLSPIVGVYTVLGVVVLFVEGSHLSGTWPYAADLGTLAMSLAAYVLLFLGVLLFRRVTLPKAH